MPLPASSLTQDQNNGVQFDGCGKKRALRSSGRLTPQAPQKKDDFGDGCRKKRALRSSGHLTPLDQKDDIGDGCRHKMALRSSVRLTPQDQKKDFDNGRKHKMTLRSSGRLAPQDQKKDFGDGHRHKMALRSSGRLTPQDQKKDIGDVGYNNKDVKPPYDAQQKLPRMYLPYQRYNACHAPGEICFHPPFEESSEYILRLVGLTGSPLFEADNNDDDSEDSFMYDMTKD